MALRANVRLAVRRFLDDSADRRRLLAAQEQARGPLHRRVAVVALNDAVGRISNGGVLMIWATATGWVGYVTHDQVVISIVSFAAALLLVGLSVAQLVSTFPLFFIVFSEWDSNKSSRWRSAGIVLMTTIVVLGCLWALIVVTSVFAQSLLL